VKPVEHKSVNHSPERSKSADFVDILVFIIPCLEFVQIKLIGVLFGPELLLIVIFVYLASRRRFRIATPGGKRFLILCSLWLGSQFATDIVRRSAFADYARGWSNIGMTLVNFAVLYTLLYGRPRRLIFYGWGLVVGSLLRFMISPDIFAAGDPWKFGIGFPVTLATFLFASRPNCRGYWQITLSLIIGLINIGLGARSAGGVCVATAFYLFVSRAMARKSSESSKSRVRWILSLASVTIIGLAGVLWAYQYAASAGVLGEDARVKYENQSSGQFGVLLGGRVEMLGYLPAIYDSPILGHGSWAKDPTYLIVERQTLALMGYSGADEFSNDELELGLIPEHSYLFGAWVDAGILGAVFWAWVFLLDAKTLMRVYPPTTMLLPVMSYVGFELLWDIIFSPYGAEVRIIVPFYAVMLMTCSDLAPRKAAQVEIGIPEWHPARAGG
jgi:hypothetical protein